jgi:Snf7
MTSKLVEAAVMTCVHEKHNNHGLVVIVGAVGGGRNLSLRIPPRFVCSESPFVPKLLAFGVCDL